MHQLSVPVYESPRNLCNSPKCDPCQYKIRYYVEEEVSHDNNNNNHSVTQYRLKWICPTGLIGLSPITYNNYAACFESRPQCINARRS